MCTTGFRIHITKIKTVDKTNFLSTIHRNRYGCINHIKVMACNPCPRLYIAVAVMKNT